jgi:hypothetical protein
MAVRHLGEAGRERLDLGGEVPAQGRVAAVDEAQRDAQLGGASHSRAATRRVSATAAASGSARLFVNAKTMSAGRESAQRTSAASKRSSSGTSRTV